MVTYIIHLIIAGVLTYFSVDKLTWLPDKAASYFAAFAGWYIVLWLLSYFYDRRHFRKTPFVVLLAVFFLKELLVASLKIAFDVITPKYLFKPAVLALPLEARSDIEITILANLITLTPGTLSIDISEDRTILYVHSLYGDRETVKENIKNGFEKKLLKITR